MHPLARYVTGSKKSVPHYGSGEIINDRCTNPTPRALLRYLKTESRRMIAEREARCERRAARIRSLQAGWIGWDSLIPPVQAHSETLVSLRAESVLVIPMGGGGNSFRAIGPVT